MEGGEGNGREERGAYDRKEGMGSDNVSLAKKDIFKTILVQAVNYVWENVGHTLFLEVWRIPYPKRGGRAICEVMGLRRCRAFLLRTEPFYSRPEKRSTYGGGKRSEEEKNPFTLYCCSDNGKKRVGKQQLSKKECLKF